MLTCERRSSSFKHHRLHEPSHALLAEHHHDLIRAECSTILLPHYPDLVFSKHIDDNFCHFFSYYKNDAFILIFSLANSGTTTTAGNCKAAFVSVPLGGDTGVKDSRAISWLNYLDCLTYFCIFPPRIKMTTATNIDIFMTQILWLFRGIHEEWPCWLRVKAISASNHYLDIFSFCRCAASSGLIINS